MSNIWSNWSGFVTAEPRLIASPADAGELGDLVRTAPGPIRVVGAGHSFTPLVKSQGTILSLERLEGLVSHESATRRCFGRRRRVLQPPADGFRQTTALSRSGSCGSFRIWPADDSACADGQFDPNCALGNNAFRPSRSMWDRCGHDDTQCQGRGVSR